MPRPLRIEFPDACYHVICRGNARWPIFGDYADKELLLDRLTENPGLRKRLEKNKASLDAQYAKVKKEDPA